MQISAAVVAIASMFLALAPGEDQPAAAPTTAPARVAMVVPFENLSGYNDVIMVQTNQPTQGPADAVRVDRLAVLPQSIIEDIIVNIPGSTVVERKRLDQLIQEGGFQAQSGLVDQSSAIRMGKQLGANVIVMGTIDVLTKSEKSFAGYGVAVRQVLFTGTVRVRALDVETGRIVFSKTVTGDLKQNEGEGNAEIAVKIVRTALESLRTNADFMRVVTTGGEPANGGASDALVDVTIEPQPKNCDIDIGGQYVGGSPLVAKLPAGRLVIIKIGKAGFVTWEKPITPQAGMKITPELEQIPTK